MSAASEPRFIVYDDERPVNYKEGRLVRAIRAGELEGDELFRREDESETALRPLHESVLFQQVHGVDADGAARIVDVNKVQNFSRHLTSFAAVVLALTVIGVNTSWAVFWAIGLAVHFGKIAGSFSRLHTERNDHGIQAILGVLYGLGERALPAPADREASREPDPMDEIVPDRPPRAAKVADEIPESPLHAELREEMERLAPLRDALDAAGREALDETGRVLEDLFERRRRIAVHLHGEDEDSLTREAAELETELADPSLDHQTREALEQTMEAVQQRQESLADTRRADQRLRARARSALHQLKSLRLSLVTSVGDGPDHEMAAPLGRVVGGLREEMAGSEELEEALAEARQGPRARRRIAVK